MATYMEADQLCLSLKMKYSVYSWYKGCEMSYGDGDYFVVVYTNKLDNKIRKLIAPIVNGIIVKTEIV